MKNPKIGLMLKYYRKLRNMSVNDVASTLAENNVNVATKTIYGWENGNTQPDADTLLLLCDIYEIDNILDTFGYNVPETNPVILTEFEKELIRKYRSMPELHSAIHKLLDLDRTKKRN